MDIHQLIEDFPSYLTKNQLALPKHIPHLQRWAEHYLMATHDPGLRPDDRLRAFLADLKLRRGLAAWQIAQAENAVILLRQFAVERSSVSTKTTTAPSANVSACASMTEEQFSCPRPDHAWKQTWADEKKLLLLRHYSPKTITAYLDWARRFAGYCGMRPPAGLGEVEVKRFLTHLAMERRVSASTQNQAFNALLFLFREVKKDRPQGYSFVRFSVARSPICHIRPIRPIGPTLRMRAAESVEWDIWDIWDI